MSHEVIAPRQQEGSRAVVRHWLLADGASVSKDQPVVELETDKVLVEVSAPCAGVLRIVVPEDSPAGPGEVLGRVEEGASITPSPAMPSSQPALEQRLSPAVRRLLREHPLDPASLHGTGRGGRITREDVLAALDAPKAPTPPSGQVPSHSVAHTPMRRRIAQHMLDSVTQAPQVTAVFEADFGALIAHRQAHRQAFADQGVKLSFTAYFVAAAAQAMARVPAVNSRWHADRLELFEQVNIGVGTALGDDGLVVPVIQDVGSLSLLAIARALQRQTEAARNGRLRAEDLQGGTFSISNHGVSGSLLAAPIIINQPQSAILGVGAMEKRVVVREVDGQDCLVIRPRAYVTLTIDHRALDGAQANAWLSRFVEVIEGWPREAR